MFDGHTGVVVEGVVGIEVIIVELVVGTTFGWEVVIGVVELLQFSSEHTGLPLVHEHISQPISIEDPFSTTLSSIMHGHSVLLTHSPL